MNVQSSYVGVQVRSMPTFHFYLGGKLEHQFSGGDERGLRMWSQKLAQKASIFFAHRTHFSHMSHRTFPISHILILFLGGGHGH